MRVAVDLTAACDAMQTKTPRMAGGILGNIEEEILSNPCPVIERRQAKLQRSPQEPKLDHLNDAWAPPQSTERGRTTRLTPWVCIPLLQAPQMPFIAELSRLALPLETPIHSGVVRTYVAYLQQRLHMLYPHRCPRWNHTPTDQHWRVHRAHLLPGAAQIIHNVEHRAW